MTHVIDTPQIYSVIKSLRDDDPLREVIQEISRSGRLYISVISHGEVISQISRISESSVRHQADQNYKTLLASIGSKNIIPVDEAVSVVWAKNCALCPVELHADASSEALLVASTAEYYGYTLVCESKPWHKALTGVSFRYVDK